MLLLAFAVISALTAGRLRMELLPMLGAVLLAAPSLVGIGYAVAGLLLLVKKVEIAQPVDGASVQKAGRHRALVKATRRIGLGWQLN